MKGFYITTDRTKMDVDFIHKYLSEDSYWAKGRSRVLVEKSMDNSLCFAVMTQKEEQVAFARVVTDFVVFAWVMDVFVDADFQGKGLGKWLVGHIVNLPELKRVNGVGLRTRDAHRLYGQFGFGEIPDIHTWMLRKNG